MTSAVERIGAHLDSALALHQWAHQHLPAAATAAESRLAFDLFLQLGRLTVQRERIDLAALCRALGCSQGSLRQLLERWRQAGLLASDGGQLKLSERFGDALKQYAEFSSHTFVLRQDVRRQQLQIAAPDPHLADFAEMLFDRFHDLGWLYLHNYGAVCFLMAQLVQHVAELHGHKAHTVSGYVRARRPDGRGFLLGANRPVPAGQVAGHAFCVVDDVMVVDFGLGNLRRNFTRSFPWALACVHQPQPGVRGQMVLGTGTVVQWQDDWVYPESQAEFDKFEPLTRQLAAQYAARHGLALPQDVAVPDTQPGGLDEPMWPSPLPAPRLNAVAGR